MTLTNYFNAGAQSAFARFKLAAGSMSSTTTAPGVAPAPASTPTSVSTAAPKPVVPTVSPMAPQAHKAAVL